jgi:hypothetical protein
MEYVCDFNPDLDYRSKEGIASETYEEMLALWAQQDLSEWYSTNSGNMNLSAGLGYVVCRECWPERLLLNKLTHGVMD